MFLLSRVLAASPPRLDDSAAWREACATGGYSCAGLRRPMVAETPLLFLYGRYRMGDSYILVSEAISGNLAYAVRVHEMTHYIQWHRGAWTSTHDNKCKMEHEAFEVSNKVLRRLGEDARVVDWDKAKAFYGCET